MKKLLLLAGLLIPISASADNGMIGGSGAGVTTCTGQQFLQGPSSCGTPAGSGGAAALAISNGASSNVNPIISSPTANINFDSKSFLVNLAGSATTFVQLSTTIAQPETFTSSVTFSNAQGILVASSPWTTVNSTGPVQILSTTDPLNFLSNGSAESNESNLFSVRWTAGIDGTNTQMVPLYSKVTNTSNGVNPLADAVASYMWARDIDGSTVLSATGATNGNLYGSNSRVTGQGVAKLYGASYSLAQWIAPNGTFERIGTTSTIVAGEFGVQITSNDAITGISTGTKITILIDAKVGGGSAGNSFAIKDNDSDPNYLAGQTSIGTGANSWQLTLGTLGLAQTEGTAPSNVSGGEVIWGDSTDHWLKMNPNAGQNYDIAGSSAAGTQGHMAVYGSNGFSLIDGGVPSAGGGGGGSSTLAVTTGTSSGFQGPPVSSPTAVIVVNSADLTSALQGGSTNFLALAPSITSNHNWTGSQTFSSATVSGTLTVTSTITSPAWQGSGTGNMVVTEPNGISGQVVLSTSTVNPVAGHPMTWASSMTAVDFGATIPPAWFPALTGDITTSAGSLATTAAASQSNIKTFTSNITVTSTFTVQTASFSINGVPNSFPSAACAQNQVLVSNGGTNPQGWSCQGQSGTGGGIVVYSGTPASLASTVYFPMGGGVAPSTIEASVDSVSPSAATITNFSAQLGAALGVGNSEVFTWRKNGTNQSLTCTISGATADSCSDNSHSFTVSQGDTVTIQAAPGGSVVVTPNVIMTAQFGTTGSNGTVNNGSANQAAYYSAAGTAVSGTGNLLVWPSSLTVVGSAAIPTIVSSLTVTGLQGSSVTYNMTVGSFTGAGLTTCGDSTHAVGYSATTNLFSCQSVTGSGGGGGSALAVSTGGTAGFQGPPISSPTAVILVDTNTMTGQLLASNTFFMRLSPTLAQTETATSSFTFVGPVLHSSYTYITSGIYLSTTSLNTATNVISTTATVVLASATAGGSTYSLPVASMAFANGAGQVIHTIKVDGSTNPITIAVQNADLISGSTTTWILNAPGQYCDLFPDMKGNWWPGPGGCQATPDGLYPPGGTVAGLWTINGSSSIATCPLAQVNVPVCITGVAYGYGTVNGKLSLGIMNQYGNVVVSSNGITSVAAGNVFTAFSPPVCIPPGNYYEAAQLSNTTGRLDGWSVTNSGQAHCGNTTESGVSGLVSVNLSGTGNITSVPFLYFTVAGGRASYQ